MTSAAVLPLRAASHVYYRAADSLRALARAALLRGEHRQAAQMYAEANVMRSEGDEALMAELKASLEGRTA